MPAPKDIDFDENPFGHELRRQRERKGIRTQGQLAERLGYSADLISKVETGAAPPSEDFVRDCDTFFETHGAMETLARLARKVIGFPSWFRWWAERIEPEARTLRSWEPDIVPGLLQTDEYARELTRTYPWLDDGQIDKQVTARLERQKVLDRDNPPMLWVVLHENALHGEVGGSKVMREQLQALTNAAKRPRVTIQVVPRSSGMHAGHLGAFVVASLNGRPDVVYLENARAGQVIDRLEDVQEMTNIWQAICMKALPDDASQDLIVKVMEQWI